MGRDSKQLRFEDRKWCFTPLKTRSSYRDIEITAVFADFLRALKEKQDESRRFYWDGYHLDNVVWDRREKNQDERIIVKDFINIKTNGAMLTSDSEKFLARIIKADCGIPFKFHNLRHPYVKHTTKKYNSEKQKSQATKMDLIAWVFRFFTFNCSKRSWTL